MHLDAFHAIACDCVRRADMGRARRSDSVAHGAIRLKCHIDKCLRPQRLTERESSVQGMRLFAELPRAYATWASGSVY